MNISCNEKFYLSVIAKIELIKGTGKLKIGMGCVGIANDIHLMQSEEAIYVDGRNYTFKIELQ